MTDDLTQKKLAMLEADMRVVLVRLDRLESVQGTGLSVAQALTALDRYDAQEDADAAIQKRMDALERMVKAYAKLSDDACVHNTMQVIELPQISDARRFERKCLNCGKVIERWTESGAAQLAQGSKVGVREDLADVLFRTAPRETPLSLVVAKDDCPQCDAEAGEPHDLDCPVYEAARQRWLASQDARDAAIDNGAPGVKIVDARCESCGVLPGDMHADDCEAMLEGAETLDDHLYRIKPEETPARTTANDDGKYWAGGAPKRRKRTWRTLWL